MAFHQLRLEVVKVEMAGGARHEELHDPFRLGRPMQDAAQLTGGGQGLIPTEQGRQGDTAETAAGTPEELTTTERRRHGAMEGRGASHRFSRRRRIR